MKFLKSIMIVALIAVSFQAIAQRSFELTQNPKLHTIPEAFKKESAVYIISDRKVDYSILEKKGETYVVQTITTHGIAKVLDSKGVEAFNTIHLPVSDYIKYTTIKSQSITADGKVIEIKDDKIKKQKDDEGNEEYFIAFEGVDVGAEVEFVLASERYVNQFEGQYAFNSSFPILSSMFQLECPQHLAFELKGYNGFKTNDIDTLESDRILHTATINNAKPLPDESYGNSFYLEPRVGYRLSYIPGATGSIRFNSWNDYAKRLNKVYLTTEDKKDIKAVNRFLKANGISTKLSKKERIIKIEEAIKSKIVINENLSSTETIGELIKNKTGNANMVTKLYAACFDAAQVEYTLGLTSNRYEYVLDDDFELWGPLDIFFFQFDNADGLIAPEYVVMRYPYVPLFTYGNKALVCNRRTLGGITTATADIIRIPSRPAEKNSSVMNIDIRFDNETQDPIVKTETAYHGLSSTMYSPIFVMSPKSEHKKILLQIASIDEKEENIKSFAIKDYELSNIPKEKPFIISTEIVSPKMMSKAGNTYLFKLGDCIGRQAEMYEEEERVLPIDIQYTHHLIRKIVVGSMPGYKIKNLNDIVIDKQFGDYGFVSSYKMEGDKLVIDIDEYYKKLEFPKSDIESFRSVINAAADFNKVTLVFEPE